MGKRLDQMFPLRQIRNVAMFYVLTGVYNLWFVAGIWVFIWGRFMTKTQIGISDAMTFSIGFLLELPSGVFADLIGRRKSILLGNICLALGNLGVALGSSFWGLTAWYLLWTIGYAFKSGATEALAYDSVKLAGKQDEWNKVIGTTTIIIRVASMTANVIGGLLFAVWFRLPYLVFGISGIIGIVAAYRLVEIPVKHGANSWSVATYFRQIKEGVSVLGKPKVMPVALVSLCVAGLAYIYNWGLLRPLTGERFGFTPVTFPLLLVAVSIAVIVVTVLLVRLKHRFQLETVLFGVAASYAGLFILMGNKFNWWWGGLIMILVTVCSAVVDQLFSQFINIHSHSEHRATTLSAVALFTKLPYVVLAILLGVLAEKNLLAQFCMVVGLVVAVVWVVAVNKYTRLPHEEAKTVGVG
jgi:MFS family permease